MTEKMKPSGIDYLGNIPVSWDAKRFKYCVQICNGGEYADIEVEEAGYPVIGSGGEFARASKYCYRGESVLLGRKGTVDKPLYVNDAFWCVDTMFYTKAKQGMIPKFLYYCTLCFRFDYYVTATALPSMTQKDLGSEMIAVPPIEEQQAIADFLDTQCAKIDSVIADIEKQIETLQQYKKSLIIEAVTKGSVHGVSIKAVNLDFANEINADWQETRVKYLCSMYSGDNLTSSDIEPEGDYPVYGGNGLRGFYKEYTNDGEHVLIGRQGALCGNVHLVSGKFWATDHAVVTYPYKNVCNGYLFYLFSAMDMNQYSQTAAQPGLAVTTIQNLKTCIPPTIEQQNEIVKYLDKKCGDIDSIIEKKQKQIEIMEQHKKSLIYEYVTGKKRVAEVN